MVSRRKLARSALTVAALLAAGTTVARLKAEPSANGHVMLFPKLTAGQVLTYQIAYHSDKSAKTKSTVATSTPSITIGNRNKCSRSGFGWKLWDSKRRAGARRFTLDPIFRL